MKKILLWVFAIAGALLIVVVAGASLWIGQCVNNFACVSQFQYAYLDTMNNAIERYDKDIFSCSAREQNDGVDFLTPNDLSDDYLECRKIDTNIEGIVTKTVGETSR